MEAASEEACYTWTGRITYSLEHFLSETHRDLHCNPVLRRRTRQIVLVDAMGGKPLIDKVDALVLRRNEGLDLLLGEVLAVAIVERITGKTSSEAEKRCPETHI